MKYMYNMLCKNLLFKLYKYFLMIDDYLFYLLRVYFDDVDILICFRLLLNIDELI